MSWIACVIGVLSLALGSVTLFHRRSARPLALMLMNWKLLATALAPYVALAGVVGVLLGVWAHSRVAVVAGLAGAVLAVDYVRRVVARHHAFERAFGDQWRTRIDPEAESRMLPRRWMWRGPSAPEPRWTRDVAFWTIPDSDRQLLADVWQPPSDVEPTGAAIVYLHGSAWYLLDKDVLTRRFFGHLAAQGHVVMDVAYRLCPEVGITDMVGDAARAVCWIKSNGAEYGVDPQRIVLMGASAGAHVALLAAYGHNQPQFRATDLEGVDTSVIAVVSYYGVADLREFDEYGRALFKTAPEPLTTAVDQRPPGRRTDALNRLLVGRTLTARQAGPAPPHSQMMRDLVGGSQDEVSAMYDLASPIHHVSAESPPTLLFHGTHDSLVPVGPTRRLHHVLRAAGVPAVYVEYPRTEHGFDLLYPPLQSPAAQSAMYDLERFLAYVVSGHSGDLSNRGDSPDCVTDSDFDDRSPRPLKSSPAAHEPH